MKNISVVISTIIAIFFCIFSYASYDSGGRWNSGGGGIWGNITGTLSNQTDLQSTLDTKVDETGGNSSGQTLTSPVMTNPTSSGGTFDGGTYSNMTFLGSGFSHSAGWINHAGAGNYTIDANSGYDIVLGSSTATNKILVVENGGVTTAIPVHFSRSVVIEYPSTSTDILLWRVPHQITIRAVHLQTTSGTSSSGMLEEWNSNGAALVAAVDSTSITANAGANANDDGALSDPVIAAGNYLYWNFSSVAGTPTATCITYEYTVN